MKKVITGRSETENILIHLPWVLKFLYKSTAKFPIKLAKSDAPWAYVVGNKTSWLNEKNLSLNLTFFSASISLISLSALLRESFVLANWNVVFSRVLISFCRFNEIYVPCMELSATKSSISFNSPLWIRYLLFISFCKRRALFLSSNKSALK